MNVALKLPEIVARSVEHLELADQVRCMSVCRMFWEELVSMVWNDVTLVDCVRLLPNVEIREDAPVGVGRHPVRYKNTIIGFNLISISRS